MSISELFISERDTSTHRVCGTCGQLKPVKDFYKDGKDYKGNVRYRRDCRDCYKQARLREGVRKHDN